MKSYLLSGIVIGSFLLSGCGGPSPLDNAVVVPDPSVDMARIQSSGKSADKAAPVASTGAAMPPAAAVPAAAASAPAAVPTVSDGFGTLKGKVVLEGGKPTLKLLVTKGDAGVKDPTVCAVSNVVNEAIEVDDASKGVKNVLVYIPKPTSVNPEAVKALMSAKIVFDQKNCVFKPHVLGLMKGQTLDITSSDSVGHNVNAKMRTNGASNNLLSPGAKSTFVPKASEGRPSEVTCDIHPWMKAYWLILDNPYFAITDSKGEFEIKMVPAGTQKVVVWQEAVQYLTPPVGMDVLIAKDAVTQQDFKVDATKIKIN